MLTQINKKLIDHPLEPGIISGAASDVESRGLYTNQEVPLSLNKNTTTCLSGPLILDPCESEHQSLDNKIQFSEYPNQ